MDNDILEELRKPLDPTRVAKRAGAGNRQLSYLETYDVIDTLNRIFGYGGWSDRVLEIAPVNEHLWRATVQLEAYIGDRLVTHSDTGIGVAKGTSTEELEKCVKECCSDALKRAARKFGDQFGNCLYDKHAPEHGTQSTQQRPQQAQSRPAQSTPARGDVPLCPKCSNSMYDNRLTKTNPKAPDFKCKNKECGHGVWLNGSQSAPAPAVAAPEPVYEDYGDVDGADITWLIDLRDWMAREQPQHPQLAAIHAEIKKQQAAAREALEVAA
jgi:DNA recombination protein Rad52